MNQYTFLAVQLLLGATTVLIVYLVTLAILREKAMISFPGEDKAARPNTGRQRSMIMSGFTDTSVLAYRRFNTVNPYAYAYVNLPRSRNRTGGAQFTYSFWMHVGDATEENIRGKDILLRGDVRKYNFRNRKDSFTNLVKGNDVVVKCPRIRFGRTFRDFVLEFNTLDDVMHTVHMDSQQDPTDTTLRHNATSLILNRWALFTFTFEDNTPINDFENGLVVRMFLNDILYHTHRERSALRQNTGDLYLFPGGEVRGCKMGDLAYYNHALGFEDVRRVFQEGRPTQPVGVAHTDDDILFGSLLASPDRNIDGGRPLHLSEYNKVDIYNL